MAVDITYRNSQELLCANGLFYLSSIVESVYGTYLDAFYKNNIQKIQKYICKQHIYSFYNGSDGGIKSLKIRSA